MNSESEEHVLLESLSEQLERSHEDALERVSSSVYRVAFLERVEQIQGEARKRRRRRMAVCCGLILSGCGLAMLGDLYVSRDAEARRPEHRDERSVGGVDAKIAPHRVTERSDGPEVIRVKEEEDELFYVFESQKTDYTSFEVAQQELLTFWLEPSERVTTRAPRDGVVVVQHGRRAILWAQHPGKYVLKIEGGGSTRHVDVHVVDHLVDTSREPEWLELPIGDSYELLRSRRVLDVFVLVGDEAVEVNRSEKKWRVMAHQRGEARLLVLEEGGDMALVQVGIREKKEQAK